MERRFALALFVVVALAVALAAYFARRESSPPIAPEAPVRVDAPEARADEMSAATDVASLDARVAVDPDTVDPDTVDERPAIPADSTWLDVRVVDDGAPVPGARVLWQTEVTWLAVGKLAPREQLEIRVDQEASTQRFGWETRADAAGVARVAAAPSSGATVYAYADGRFGTCKIGGRLKEPQGGWQVELEADRTLRVQVLDAAGQPAVDVEVGIVLTKGDDPTDVNRGFIRPVLTTAPDGTAEFRHVQDWPQRMSRVRGEAVQSRVALRVPGHDDPGVVVDVAEPPVEPIVLRLPPTGRLHARLLHQGQPLIRDTTFVCWHGPKTLEKRNFSRRFLPGDDGWIHVPYVALGVPITVLATRGQSRFETEVPGLLTPGQDVRVELDTDGVAVLAGQLLGPDGAPLADTTVSVEFDLGMSQGGSHIGTDAQGRFLWFLPNSERALERLEMHHIVFSLRSSLGTPPSARISGRAIRRGINDLGVIRLGSGPLVVAGRIEIDPPGAFVPTLQVQAASADPRRGAEVWGATSGLSVEQKEDGRFAVYGETQPVRHRLAFPSQQHLPIAPVEFAVGAEDIVVRLEAGAVVDASARASESAHGDMLTGVLVPYDERVTLDDERDRCSRPVPSDGSVRLHWQGLPRGTYRLELRLHGVRDPLVTIEDVVLPLPEGGDPRLVDIDLGAATRPVKVTTIPGAGGQRPTAGYHVFVLPQQDPAGWVGTRLPLDGGELLVPKGHVELFVAAEGFQPRTFACDGPEVRVQLEPWPTVELSVTDLPPLPDGVDLQLALKPSTRSDVDGRAYRTSTGGGNLARLIQPARQGAALEDGRVRLPIGEGAHRIVGLLRRVSDPQWQSVTAWTPSEIVGGADPAPVTVRCDTEVFQAALAKLLEGAK